MRNTCTNNRTGHRTGGTQVQITELGTEHVKLSVQLLELRIGHRAARRRNFQNLAQNKWNTVWLIAEKYLRAQLRSWQYYRNYTYRYSSANYELLSS